jgi:hypothetical protein
VREREGGRKGEVEWKWERGHSREVTEGAGKGRGAGGQTREWQLKFNPGEAGYLS